MHPEPFFSCRGTALYRTHWAHGVFVAEQWSAGAWRAVSDVDYVMHKTVSIPAHRAAEMIERAGPTPSV